MAQKTSSRSGGLRRASTKSMKNAGRATKRAKDGEVLAASPGDDEVSIDRRRNGRRDEAPAASTAAEAGPKLERRKKVNRRRQIDPTTCERDYTDQEVEFMNALDDYKRKSGRMFPTCSEVLEVLRGLGYVKLSAAEMNSMTLECPSTASAKPMPGDWQGTDLELSDVAVAFATEPNFVG